MRRLAQRGWVLIPSAIDAATVTGLVHDFDAEIAEHGYKGRFASTAPILAKDLPHHFWSIDTVLLPLGPAATKTRMLARQAFAREVNVDAESLVSSFDGVMIGHSNSMGVGRGAIPQRIELVNPKLPICEEGGGGAHIDQRRDRISTSESHQIYVALTKTSHADLSTAFLSPTNGWSIEGVAIALRHQFPDFYNDRKRKRGDIAEEGYKFPGEQQDWLLAQRMCTVVKPSLNPGDLLIWSSALPHCGATGVHAPGQRRRARLGVVTAFAPAALVPPAIQALRRKIVGGGFATGQQILHASKHGCTFPSTLRRYVNPAHWPVGYTELLKRRDEYAVFPLYHERPDDDDAAREWRQSLRSLLGT